MEAWVKETECTKATDQMPLIRHKRTIDASRMYRAYAVSSIPSLSSFLICRRKRGRRAVSSASLMAAISMKCYQFHFLSLGIGGRVASPLPHRLIFPRSLYSSWPSWLGVQVGGAEISGLDLNPEPLESIMPTSLTTATPLNLLSNTSLSFIHTFTVSVTLPCWGMSNTRSMLFCWLRRLPCIQSA